MKNRSAYDHSRYMAKLLYDPRLVPAGSHFETAFRLSRKHKEECLKALAKYGDGDGVLISGVFRDHFPDMVKEKLREYCRLMNKANDVGFTLKPKGMHRHTFANFRDAVRKEFGTGFYL